MYDTFCSGSQCLAFEAGDVLGQKIKRHRNTRFACVNLFCCDLKVCLNWLTAKDTVNYKNSFSVLIVEINVWPQIYASACTAFSKCRFTLNVQCFHSDHAQTHLLGYSPHLIVRSFNCRDVSFGLLTAVKHWVCSNIFAENLFFQVTNQPSIFQATQIQLDIF